jgi:hypothetical protein
MIKCLSDFCSIFFLLRYLSGINYFYRSTNLRLLFDIDLIANFKK